MKTILIAVLLALATAAFAEDKKSSPAILGYLETRDHVVAILAGAEPRYTVRSKDGKLLAERLSRKELSAKFPGLRSVVDGTCAQWAGL